MQIGFVYIEPSIKAVQTPQEFNVSLNEPRNHFNNVQCSPPGSTVEPDDPRIHVIFHVGE
jgi:hypothetical protein